MFARNMRIWGIVCAVLIWGCMQSYGIAQEDNNTLLQLKQQIQRLEAQLNLMETPRDTNPHHSSPIASRSSNRHVTEIGGGRIISHEPQMIVRMYDLSDLFVLAPPYDATQEAELGSDDAPFFPNTPGQQASAGFGGGGFFSFPSSARTQPPRKLPGASKDVLYQVNVSRLSIEDLVDAITKTITPNTWSTAGGPATISRLGNALLISSDTNTHQQIDTLLALFRARWGTLRTISVQAHWLWLTERELNQLITRDVAEANKPDSIKAFGLVNRDAWKQHLTDLAKPGNPAKQENKRREGYQAAVTCYNGQTVHTTTGSQRIVVTEMRPVVLRGNRDEDGKGERDLITYRPQTKVLQDGAALQITPLANGSGKFVVLDIHSRVSEYLPEPTPAAPQIQDANANNAVANKLDAADHPLASATVSPAELVRLVNRSQFHLHRLSTTLRIPVDHPMLVGGMTYESKPKSGDQQLYLFVNVATQNLRDDQSTQATTPEPADQPKEAPKK